MGTHRINPELREVVIEASLALARLDAERLEELALCCQALNRDFVGVSDAERKEAARQARETAGELTAFGRILEGTRANLEVLARVRDRQAARLEYGRACGAWVLAEKGNGDH